MRNSASSSASRHEWTYYLLGGTKEQLSVWQGTQTSEVGFCGSTRGDDVYFYPTEYLTYAIEYPGIREDIPRLRLQPDGGIEYRITDHLGSNRVTLDGSGVVTNTYDYEPFGGILSSGGEARQGFNSREKDQESDLFNNGVRKLDDNIGRFTSIDPLWEKFPSWSPYQYGYNNPLRVTDPSGMQGRTPITPQVEMGPDGLPSLYRGLHYPSNAIRIEQLTAPWMGKAQAEIGQKEIKGSKHNPRIIEYHSTTGGFTDDETPWCASFCNWVMEQSGYEGTGSARALSWKDWGVSAGDEPVYGAIAVIDYGGGKGHVGFVTGIDGDNITVLLGGNQSDQVKESKFKKSSIVAYRFPTEYDVLESEKDLENINVIGIMEDLNSTR